MNPHRKPLNQSEIWQFLSEDMLDPIGFHAFINSSPSRRADTPFRRFCTPLFQSQFRALDTEKQALVVEAMDSFQREREVAEGCCKIFEESESLFQLEAGQGVSLVAGLRPFAGAEDCGVFLFVGTQPEEKNKD